MKLKDLRQYKPLDITELPGKEWSVAEKVLGLDENDKVVMAEPEEGGSVTPEYVDNAIDQAIATETARTESTYMKNSSLDDYATKQYVDDAISEIDLSNYYTKAEVDEAIDNVDVSDQLANYALISSVTADINTAIANETARTENTYAKPSDIPSLDGYAKTTAVTQDIQTAIASETARTEDVYAKKSEVPDLDDYYTKDEVDTEIAGAAASETARTENEYIRKDYFSGVGYSTVITEVQGGAVDIGGKTYDLISKNYKTPNGTIIGNGSLVTFVKKINNESIIASRQDILAKDNIELPTFSDVSTAITDSIRVETARTENTYAKIGDIPSLDGYWTSAQTQNAITAATDDMATETWVGQQGYLTQHQDISGKLDVSTFNTYTGATETVLEGKADVSDIPDVSDFVTSGDVATQIGTAMDTETARTESIYAKKSEIPDLDGYATEQYVNGQINLVEGDIEGAMMTATATTTGWVESQGYLTEHQDISGKLDVSVFTGYTGTTETAISGKVDKTDFNTYTGATETALAGKVSESTYSAYTGSTATAIAAKQDTLVSGTNIKTINNQSLLGSGNIDIQGGGGGGSVVELTKAQYDALDPPAADTTYIITDAETVDLNDYAMASGLTELSGTVQTLSTTVSNKADKQSVTARASNSNYLPGWNAQGVITGSTAYYDKSQGINGINYNVFSNSNTNHPAIFAPTSAGTAGQPLLSNGSGAPVWGGYKFAFISQSQYDALTTPDSTTIYFIVDPN